MRKFDRMKQESVKPQAFLAPSAQRAASWATPCAETAALWQIHASHSVFVPHNGLCGPQ